MNKYAIPWGVIGLTDGSLRLDLPLGRTLQIKREGDETLIFRNGPEGEQVNRYITGTGQSLFLEPGLPDLPMILKPAVSLSILPEKKMETLVEVPLLVKVLIGNMQKKELLLEFPLQSLSRSFFGNPDTGEIAYFLESPLYNRVEEYGKPGCSVYCPLTIFNRSDQNLDFERMIFRVPYLSLFYGEKHLYSSPVFVSFRGADQISQISYRKQAPSYEPNLAFASPPRKAEDKGLLKRSFYFIKTLYNG